MAASLRITGHDLARTLQGIADGAHSIHRRAGEKRRRRRSGTPPLPDRRPLSEAERRYLDHAEEEGVDRTFRGPPADEGAGW